VSAVRVATTGNGRLTRRELLRRGWVVGAGGTLLAAGLAACGGSGKKRAAETTAAAETASATPSTPAEASSAGTGGEGTAPGSDTGTAPTETIAIPEGPALRAAVPAPQGSLDPALAADIGAIVLAQQAGEYLVWVENDLTLRPVLAERWAPNDDGTEWTFALHDGVAFHDGTPLTAADVAATFDRITDPVGGSPAAASFAGVLAPGGTRAVDDRTIVFTLERPTTDFPYLVSSQTPNAIVLPAGAAPAADGAFVGSGPFRLARYAAGEGATLVAHDAYWNQERAPIVPRVDLVFQDDQAAALDALRAGELEVVHGVPYAGVRALLDDPNLVLLSARTAAHPQIHLRNDVEPFSDVRVRQAIALLVDRDRLMETLFDFQADAGNDSPLAPVYPITDPEVPQRSAEPGRARQLLQQAGAQDLALELTVPAGGELRELAAALAEQLGAGGITVTVVEGDAAAAVAAPFGIAEVPHRATPNAVLASTLTTDGEANAAHYASPEYDELVRQFDAVLSDEERFGIAGAIQRLLLEEVPVVIPYFPSSLRMASVRAVGVDASPWGYLDLTQAALA